MGIAFSSLCRLAQALLRFPTTTGTTPILILPNDTTAETTPLLLPNDTTGTTTPAPLPNDVVFNILSRVDVKSLCRWRCVSKEWHALISDPAFIAVHKSLAEPLVVAGYDEALWLIDMDGDVVKVIDGVGSVSDVICTSSDNLACLTSHSGHVKVVDLATEEVILTCQRDGLLGFGRTSSSSSSVYKMVHIDININICEILTVGDALGWRPMQFPPTSHISCSSNLVVVNGVLHLVLESQLDGNSVFCFDLASEEWKKGIKGPPDVHPLYLKEPTLSELNGSLCMVQPVAMGRDTWTNIWRLTDSSKSTWVKEYAIPSSTWFQLIPLRILRDDDKKLLFCNFRETSSTVQIYDARRWRYTCAPNALFDHYVYVTNFSPCSLPLESFVLAKR